MALRNCVKQMPSALHALAFRGTPEKQRGNPSWLEALLDAAFPANSPAFRGTPEKLRGDTPLLEKKPRWTLRFFPNSPAPVSVVPPETTLLSSLLNAAQKQGGLGFQPRRGRSLTALTRWDSPMLKNPLGAFLGFCVLRQLC